MFPWKIVQKGFLLAPLLPCVIFLISGFSEGLVYGLVGAVGHALVVYVVFLIGCYLYSLVLTLPLYYLCWKHFRVSFLSCMAGGALIGGGPPLAISLLQIFGLWATWQDESLGGVPLIVANKFTRAGIIHYLLSGVPFALVGIAIAFMFWFFAIRNNPPAQSRRQALDSMGSA